MQTLTDKGFWVQEEARLEFLLGSNQRRGVFNVELQRSQRTCLGAALGLEQDAIEMTMAGLDRHAMEYFVSIKQLALAAFEGDERYVYKDPDGRNLFGKYMAMRIVCLAEWAIGGAERFHFQQLVVSFFEKVAQADLERGKTAYAASSSTVIGCLAMHYAQSGLWERVQSLPKTYAKPARVGVHWASLHEAIDLLASAIVTGDAKKLAVARKRLDTWFRAHLGVERFQRPFDPRFTTNDMVSIAEIRARWLHGVTDPWATIKSIRWPGVVENQATR